MAQGVIFHFDSHIAQRKYCNIEHDGVALKKDVYELVNYLKSMNVPICPITSSLQKRVSNILDLMSYFVAFVLKDSEAEIETGYLGNVPVICIPDRKQLDKSIKTYVKQFILTLFML